MITSEKTDAIAAALSKAQAVMEPATKSSTNPFFHSKYANLAEVWDTCRKPLTDNGLCFVQAIGADKTTFSGTAPNNKMYIWLTVTSRLLHVSEQYFEDAISMPVEADPQSVGKITTYLRRYAQMALCGIAPADDDGEEAAGRGQASQQQTRPIAQPIKSEPAAREAPVASTKPVAATAPAQPMQQAQTVPASLQELCARAHTDYGLTPSVLAKEASVELAVQITDIGRVWAQISSGKYPRRTAKPN